MTRAGPFPFPFPFALTFVNGHRRPARQHHVIAACPREKEFP